MTADAEWIALLLAGDAAAIAQVRTWVGAALARYRNRLGAEVEDLEQEVLLDLMEALAFDAPSALDELAQRETAALAARIAAALPAPCRELWEMIADGMSYRQMSGATGLSEGAIRVRVHRCRQRAIELRLRLLAGEDL